MSRSRNDVVTLNATLVDCSSLPEFFPPFKLALHLKVYQDITGENTLIINDRSLSKYYDGEV